ncbi:type III pantothenate kinase [Flavobacterium sp. GT3R68]|uniref:type III pantothenate kinase n=1 Tax=Flavobacterium sp. GT3R68 TaxID=2594437 RepID=UPI000F860942|nr:type III pantothenate kinase [Flavobacterium sp. GT3R68]RTY92427.1 type III pantothenate kinase [Flavobacterium sp. GSN2]TRW94051.1 type III pantothenate kinase [Flavobacterium sp. GT3R68]
MLLAVDVGNTRIKVAVFEDGTLLERFVFLGDELPKNILNILNKYKNISDLVVASVGNVEKSQFLCFENTLKTHFITHETHFPFQNRYATPLTLGIDRMVLASGAVLQFPNQNRLVIDAGTCVTYDFIDKENNYIGGAISPGIRLRYESLHNYTAKLPLLSLEEYNVDNESKNLNFIGNTTQRSIHSGVINGIVNEIDGCINQYREQYSNFIIILTGGDAEFLAKRLKNTIFANSNFLLESLNQTFQFKNQK